MLKEKCVRMLHPEQGVSLIELMVGLLIGLLVVAAVGGVYVSTTRSSADILAANRLNQEVRAITELMNFEIRRAGFGLDAGEESVAIDDSGSCIVYRYQFGGSERNAGFRLNAGQIELKDGGTLEDCSSGTWAAVTDSSMVNITALDFDASGSACFDRITSDAIDCSDLVSGVLVRRITVEIAAQLTADQSVAVQTRDTIRVRNDRVF
ncbi:prepilin-type N-terminal cleavage/methylation domain-containing protein [Thauera aromatica]|uniref:prepilin-type N-terminal cleavage/methylation domain-containing protein n=1 Tax=Thauera aromatica TaxID=59405 RepID=UPI001FFD3054|nr:prepilin-type N-terminal cleavage/methylation domain-containing protein [Thauera aromatica]MCK2087795.1 prepilin-type N-terminal cleavage/methylation domain-containing protein [Thauera aromatica]MCK2127531.1 prepilin-type N-terminal cleavage/methylation domain-containing protein [Thauera aromatica]